MSDNQYLSIGEVLGLLLEDFPDVTISKIRFLESQGLIEPERTPSGYRKFYDHDVDLLRAILHEQRANFLPLKVIRDRISSGAIDSDSTARTPPRGIRNVEASDAGSAAAARDHTQPMERDSVFRRTDGGPEWAGGHALIPGEAAAAPPITAAVPVVSLAPPATAVAALVAPPTTVVRSVAAAAPTATALSAAAAPSDAKGPAAAAPTAGPITVVPDANTPLASPTLVAQLIEPPAPVDSKPSHPATVVPEGAEEATAVVGAPGDRHKRAAPATLVEDADDSDNMPFNAAELCAAASITAAQLADLVAFGIVTPRGVGVDATYHPESAEIARIGGQFLAQGIDGRHLRGWRQAADREAALFEQRIMPLLRQRNPQSRQLALDTLGELAAMGNQLHDALVRALLRHHFD